MRYIKKYKANTPDQRTVYLFHINKFELDLIVACLEKAKQYLPVTKFTSRITAQIASVRRAIKHAYEDTEEPTTSLKDAKIV